jgi:Mrp family chromosome partitioning ATPase/uncharacterized protein involved in exopolysaccharide biosynthesis
MTPQTELVDEQTGPGSITFSGFLSMLRRRVWVIVACLVLVPAAAIAYTVTRPKEYVASSQLLLRTPGTQDGLGSATAPKDFPDQSTRVATEVSIALLDPVGQRTARALRLSSLPGSIAVTPQGGANVLSITATERNPQLAARIANAYGKQYIAFRRDTDRATIDATHAQINRNLRATVARSDSVTAAISAGGPRLQHLQDELSSLKARETDLRQRLANLDTLSSLQTGNADLIQEAVPPGTPSSPNPKQNVIVGVVLGLLLGVGLAVLFEVLDPRLRHAGDVSTVFDWPVLGAIPRSEALASSDGDHLRLPVGDKESFGMLHANMSYYNADQPVRSVLVTSAMPGDGKSTVAWNIAVAGVNAGRSVLLIEADLRHPTFVERLGVPVGLSEVLQGKRTLAETIYAVAIGDRTTSNGHDGASQNGESANGSGGDNGARHNGVAHYNGSSRPELHVLAAGGPAPNPRALIASAVMLEVIREAEHAYDLVVIDTPPTSIVSDAIPLIKEVSGVLVVTRLRKNTRDAAVALRDQLHHLNARTLGIVVNSIEPEDGQYGSAHAYLRGYATDVSP